MRAVVAQHAALSPADTGAGCDNRGMDAIDREILRELMRNGRISYRDLGATVGLSANAAADRVRRLRRDGVITGFTATVDHGAAGRRLVALIDVRLAAAGTNEAFEAEMAKLEPVVDAVHVTGRFDYQLRVACRDTAELDRLLRHLKRDGGATETETRVVLRSAFTRGAP
jgi:Lrp/AsnC family transcriptional regulator, leucine-responsive regulatory protein